MEREKKLRIVLGAAHIAFAVILFALSVFAFIMELGHSWGASPETDPNYFGMGAIILYLMLGVGYCMFGASCLRVAKGWFLAESAKVIGQAIRTKLGVGLVLCFHLLFVNWQVGKIVYIVLLVLYMAAGIIELIFCKRLKALFLSTEKE